MAINEIFDDEFTKSRRGLLIVFSIGFIHQLLGVRFVDAKISIPWLPEVIASHPENLIYAYMILMLYATYRYILNSGRQFSEVCRVSLSWGVGTFWGRLFLSKLLTGDYYFVEENEQTIENNTVTLLVYEESDFIAYRIGFNLNGLLLENSWIELRPQCVSQPKALISPLKDKWSFNDNSRELVNDEQSAGYQLFTTHRIKSTLIRYSFYTIIFVSIIIGLFRKPKAFDYWTPVVLNSSLLVWLCIEKNVYSFFILMFKDLIS